MGSRLDCRDEYEFRTVLSTTPASPPPWFSNSGTNRAKTKPLVASLGARYSKRYDLKYS